MDDLEALLHLSLSSCCYSHDSALSGGWVGDDFFFFPIEEESTPVTGECHRPITNGSSSLSGLYHPVSLLPTLLLLRGTWRYYLL